MFTASAAHEFRMQELTLSELGGSIDNYNTLRMFTHFIWMLKRYERDVSLQKGK